MLDRIREWFFYDTGRKDLIFTALVLLACVALFSMETGFESQVDQEAEHVRGEVLATDDSDVQQFGIVKSGTQILQVEVLEGAHSGETHRALNNLVGKMELDTVFSKGDTVLLDLTIDDGDVRNVHASSHYRLGTEAFLLVLFAGALVLFAGFTGCKALLSFLFAALAIWKVVLPSFLKGYDPILVSLGLVAALTFIVIFLVAGFDKKGLAAFLGSFLGLGLTCVLALIFADPFHLQGVVRPFSETLLYSGYAHLDLTRIFLAGVFFASSGAVMDLGMDIAASCREIVHHHPRISPGQLLKSGLMVGRAVIGTMTTTLLLAYSGSYITMLMVFMARGIPMENILNINYVAAELLHTLVGSFGLVTVAPFTALVAAFVYTRH